MGNLVEVEANSLQIELGSVISDILPEIGDLTALEIKARAPKRSSKYSDGWTYEMEGKETVVIYNGGKRKSLSHLLELGHVSRSGSWVPPQEHIRPAYNLSKKIYKEELKKAAMQHIHHATGGKNTIN